MSHALFHLIALMMSEAGTVRLQRAERMVPDLRAGRVAGDGSPSRLVTDSPLNEFMFLLPHGQHRAGSVADHALGGAAHEDMLQAGVTVGGDDDQVNL